MSEAKEKLLAAIAALELTIESEFVPFSRSRHAGEKWLSLNWRVTLKRKGRDILTTDYSAGSAHAPGYKKLKSMGRRLVWEDNLLRWECENGYAARWQEPHYNGPTMKAQGSKTPPIVPDIADVVHSLVLDASVMDAGGYESWAREFGYDIDSRKAEAIYQACLEIALKLRAGIGDFGLNTLRAAAQDY